MRIRKRFLPSISLSSSSSKPLSDPQLSRSLQVVQPHLHGNLLLQEAQVNKTNSNPSDPQNQPFIHHLTGQEIVIGTQTPIMLVSTTIHQEQEIDEGKEIKDERRRTEEEKNKCSNDIRKESKISSAEVDIQFPQSSSSSSSCQVFDRWGEGDRIVPPKKRKGSFERNNNNNNNMGSKEMMIMIKPKMKSKTNKKCLQQNGSHDMEEGNNGGNTSTTVEAKKTISSSNSTKIKTKRGNVIMEGSRCSRVNGRGWRCCQQTLVGYSLCEHHLGKGRLRSMTSVRNRAMAAHSNVTSTFTSTTEQNEENARILLTRKQEIMEANKNVVDDQENEIRRTLAMMSRKKKVMKIGAVKARSISSLLGQTDKAGADNIAAANRNKNNKLAS